MRIIYFGAEAMAERCLDALLRAGHDVAGIVTVQGAASRATGIRGLVTRLWPPGLEGIARRHRIPLVRPTKLRAPEFLAWLESRKPDLLVVSIYDRILPPEVLALAPLGGLNIHPSLLPRWRGPAPVARAILSGEGETGLTFHLMDEGVDTGPILAQCRIPVLPDDTLLTVFDRMANAAPAVLLEAIAGHAAGTLRPLTQEGAGSAAPRITFEEGHLDWTAPVTQLLRMIRACHPQPGAFALVGGQVTVILEAEARPGEPGAVAGQVLSAGPGGVVVQASDGALCCQMLRQQGELIPPHRHGSLVEVGTVLPSGNWSLFAPEPHVTE